MCDVLDVPRSTYYKAMDKTISNRDQENHDLTGRILEIYEEVNHAQYINYKSTEFALFQYIEGWYNRKRIDRKSTRLNSSHVAISYAVFCLKKQKHNNIVN